MEETRKQKRWFRSFRKGAVSVALAGALCLAVPCGSALAEYRGFPDLDEGHWAVSSGIVDWSQEHKVINGFPDGSWAPDATVDRAQAATILWNMAGNPEPEGTVEQFPDVADADYCAKAALWCREQGIFEGDAVTGRFNPWDPITREQVAKVLCGYAGELDAPSDEPPAGTPAATEFADPESVSPWAGGVVQWAVSNGVITGSVQPDGLYLDAQRSSTRAEFVAMLARTVDGVMEGVDITDKEFVVEATWVPEYETVEVPVYEDKWVADVENKEYVRFYCRWCGYDNGCVIPLDEFFADDFLDSEWFWIRDEVFGHVQRNDCNCPPEIGIVSGPTAFDGSIGQSRGTGQQTITKAVDLGTGHWEQVQTGTKAEQVEVGGHWEYGEGSWQ